jgi:hypothetical protein
LTVCLVSALPSSAQTTRALQNQAANLMQNGDWPNAQACWEAIVQRDSTITDAYGMLARCAYHNRDWNKVISCTDKFRRAANDTNFAWIRGHALWHLGRFQESKKEARSTKRLLQKKPTLTASYNLWIQSCDSGLVRQKRTPKPVSKEALPALPGAWFAPFPTDSAVGITRHDTAGQTQTAWWHANKPDTLSPVHSATNGRLANWTFAPDGWGIGTLDDGEVRICTAQLIGDSLTHIRPLNPPINQVGSINTQPFCWQGPDSLWLAWASNRSGGKGGFDVYLAASADRVHFQRSNRLNPELNTGGNDLSPSFSPNGDTLWWASNGRISTGGYDLYLAPFPSGGSIYWPPSHINSGDDDLFPRIQAHTGRLWFTSTRPIGNQPACCSNVYSSAWTKPAERPKQIPKPTPPIDTLKVVKQEINKLFPLNLFFENDQPDPGSQSAVTSANLMTLLEEYLKKQKEYEKRYAQGQPESARRAIQSFFADSVEPGVRKLESLNKGMLRLLEKGYMLKVVLKGHCSPLASKGYNQTLSARRIDALCNTWKISMGRQWDLYTTGSNPVLQLEILPLGEETAQIGLSDNPLDQQHSVYSLSACLERRLEIIGVEMVPPNQTR